MSKAAFSCERCSTGNRTEPWKKNLAPLGAARKVPSVESPSLKLDRLWMCRIMRGRDRLALWPRNTHRILHYITLTHTLSSSPYTSELIVPQHMRTPKKERAYKEKEDKRHSKASASRSSRIVWTAALTGSMWRQYEQRQRRKRLWEEVRASVERCVKLGGREVKRLASQNTWTYCEHFGWNVSMLFFYSTDGIWNYGKTNVTFHKMRCSSYVSMRFKFK